MDFAWRSLGIQPSVVAQILDVGGAAGLHAPFLMHLCERYIVADVIDYFAKDGGEYLARVHRRFQRNHPHLDLRKLEFHYGDAQDLPYRDRRFEMIVSFNAFEHIPRPEIAFLEVARVARSGALVYLRFDPIWTSPHGSHFGQYIDREPWGHLIRSETEFLDAMVKKGAPSHHAAAFQSEMNRKPFAHYRSFFAAQAEALFEKHFIDWWPRLVQDEPRASHPNYDRLRQLGYTAEDLIVRGVCFAGIRR